MKKSKHKEMTILEASDYFDEHDIFEFEDVREVQTSNSNCRKRNMSGSTWSFSKRSKAEQRNSTKAKTFSSKNG